MEIPTVNPSSCGAMPRSLAGNAIKRRGAADRLRDLRIGRRSADVLPLRIDQAGRFLHLERTGTADQLSERGAWRLAVTVNGTLRPAGMPAADGPPSALISLADIVWSVNRNC